ncbi:MAG: tripartite tricarboxylate transporter TctB family protein [Geminicoccaceae bacterium]|nr:tripartite tricarboxylate transporter TctB family protein [Geminicoccaceae bacterium]MCB9967994.1 tripartite tricarboxylate transporter TctB family protein [Geminicoccaceae bacterium]HRY27301.1 tripartite tricarboxylate transporter TctB family protein [Geminicoccaceae bacterium]
MSAPRTDFWIGVGVVALGSALALVAVPEGVVSPRNVRIAVLSPAFWPNILAWVVALMGLVLALQSLRPAKTPDEPHEAAGAMPRHGLLRLLALGVGSIAFCAFATKLGLVWASMIAFAVVLLLTGTSYRIAAVVVAILLPLALYAFFAHVAAVPIPQGIFVRLP